MPSLALATVAFVFIWSTGWIVAKYAVPYADPLTFLAVRYASAFGMTILIAGVSGAPWPRNRMSYVHALATGVLLHALYLGAVWWAIAQGLPAGLSALIAALQPLLTALFAPMLIRERLQLLQVAGILIGFAGVIGVLSPKLFAATGMGFEGLGIPIFINLIGMVSVTFGTFYQKRFIATDDLRVVSALQYAGAFITTLPLAMLLEPMRFEFRLETWLALAWSVIALSVGAIGLMLMMIRRGAVSRLAALIYLVPPTAAIEAYFMFGETLTLVQIAFMALTATGVYLATKR